MSTNIEAPRSAGHKGRLPVKPPGERFPIRYLHKYLRAPLPAPSYPIDVTGGITSWGMLGNGPDPTCTVRPNGVGDCGFAGRVHVQMAKAKTAGIDESFASSNELVTEYLAYDHGRDLGVNLADVLLYWYKVGKIRGFAPVDHTDPTALDSAMEAFKGAYVGVSLTPDADRLFEAGKPWTTANGQQPDPSAGHCIVKVKATGHEDCYVTWGSDQWATIDWSRACVDEAWVILMEEDEHLVDIDALRADIDALGGTGGAPAPIPQPVPTPTPTPTPGGNPADDALAVAAQEYIHEHHTTAHTVAMAGALRTWLTARGYPT